MSRELWVPLPGYLGNYWINHQGKIKNCYGKILKSFMTPAGETVELRYNGIRERKQTAKLLQQTFGGVKN